MRFSIANFISKLAPDICTLGYHFSRASQLKLVDTSRGKEGQNSRMTIQTVLNCSIRTFNLKVACLQLFPVEFVNISGRFKYNICERRYKIVQNYGTKLDLLFPLKEV